MVLVSAKTCGSTVKSMAIVVFASALNGPVETVDEVNSAVLHFV